MEIHQPASSDGAEVTSLNGLTGDIILAAGTNISLGTVGNTITINSTASSGLTVGTTPIASGTSTRILYDNAGVLGEYTLTGTGTVVAMQTAPTFITNITSPLVIGGTAVGSSLSLQSTSGAGTTDFINFKVGNNGATEAARIFHNGNVNIGNTTDSGSKFTVFGGKSIFAGTGGVDFEKVLSITRSDLTTRSIDFYPSDGTDIQRIQFNGNASHPTVNFQGASNYVFDNNGSPFNFQISNGTAIIPDMSGQTNMHVGTFFDPFFGVLATTKISAQTNGINPGAAFTSGIAGTQAANLNTYGAITNNSSIVSGTGINYGLYSIGNTNYFSGNIGIGISAMTTARLQIAAGTATAGTAPIKLTAGTNLTTAEVGTMEYDGTDLFFTPTGTIRKTIPTTIMGRQTAQTAADASVVTQTVGSNDASYLVSANVNITAFVAGTFNVTVAYTDETNIAQTLKLNFASVTGTLGIALAAAGPFEGIPNHIRAKGGTTITVATSGTFTSLTYNCEAAITLIS